MLISTTTALISCNTSNADNVVQETQTKPGKIQIAYGELKDERDGNTYQTITFPDKSTWMNENLAYYSDELNIPTKTINEGTHYVKSIYSPMKIVQYKDIEQFADARDQRNHELKTYTREEQNELLGLYYTWESAKLACPSGWHLPAKDEWIDMVKKYGTIIPSNLASTVTYRINPQTMEFYEPTGYLNTNRINFEKSYYWTSTAEVKYLGLDPNQNAIYDSSAMFFEIVVYPEGSSEMKEGFTSTKPNLRYPTLLPCRCKKDD